MNGLVFVGGRREGGRREGGRERGMYPFLPSFLPSYLEILFVHRVDYVMDELVIYLSCGDMVLKRW